jgi:hypothetical protein
MNRYLKNSDWEKRLAGRLTRRASLIEVIGGRQSLREFMKTYERLVIEYVGCLLIDHKEVADAEACSTASRKIWEELIEALPDKLTSEWGEPGVRFRDILRVAVHEAHFSWSHPHRSEKVVMGRISQDEAWHQGWRSHVLRRAKERLKRHQRENEPKNIYFTIFCVWDEDHDSRHEAMIQRRANIPNGRGVTPANFRQTLGRACELFGRYLVEAVKGDYLDGDATITPADYCRAFEELDLMAYVERSDFCQEISRIDANVKKL